MPNDPWFSFKGEFLQGYGGQIKKTEKVAVQIDHQMVLLTWGIEPNDLKIRTSYTIHPAGRGSYNQPNYIDRHFSKPPSETTNVEYKRLVLERLILKRSHMEIKTNQFDCVREWSYYRKVNKLSKIPPQSASRNPNQSGLIPEEEFSVLWARFKNFKSFIPD